MSKCDFNKVAKQIIEITLRHGCSKLQSNFIEITLRHGCSPANLLHIFRAPFPKSAYGGLLIQVFFCSKDFDCIQIRSPLPFL